MGLKLVLIEWIDSAYSPSGTFSEEELDDYQSTHIVTVGFGKQLSDRWVIAKECQICFTSNGESYRYVSTIPISSVISVKFLYSKKPNKNQLFKK